MDGLNGKRLRDKNDNATMEEGDRWTKSGWIDGRREREIEGGDGWTDGWMNVSIDELVDGWRGRGGTE